MSNMLPPADLWHTPGFCFGVFSIYYIIPLGQVIRLFRQVQYQFYANDIQLYCSFKESEFHQLSVNCLASSKQWLSDNYLQLNLVKTTLIIDPEIKVKIKHFIGLRFSPVSETGVSLSVMSLTRNCHFHLRSISESNSF